MLVSLKNIRQYVNLDGLTAEEIANGLTFAGVEVEEIRTLASGTNLVIGEIKTCEKHPDSDHLHILNVDLGKYGEQQIVCGAPNARAGLKVIVARVGASPLGWTGWISLQSKGLSRVFSNTTVQKHQSFSAQLSL